jgi:hypothetical protein
VSDPVSTKILDALAALLVAAGTGAVTVDVDRDNEAEPYGVDELPALNILAVDEDVSVETVAGAAVGVPMLQDVTLSVVLQVVSRGGSAPAKQARSISAACEAAVALNPTLSGACPQVMRVTGRQWLRDDGAEQRLARMNTRLECGYRTQSTDPYNAI